MIRREEILRKIDAFPPLPEGAIRAFEWYRQTERNAGEIADAFDRDMKLKAHLQNMAGHDYFSLSDSPTSIQEIIEQLGDRRFFRLALVTTVLRWFQSLSESRVLPSWRLWEHNLAVAVGTVELVRAMNIEHPKYAFTCGFLHDLGKAILEKHLDVNSEPIIERAEAKTISIDEAERQILGIDHQEIGAEILKIWNLPAPVVEAVRWHHQPETSCDDPLLVDLVHIADGIALSMGIGPQSEGLHYHVSQVTKSRRNFKSRFVESVICEIQSELISLKNLFIPLIGDVR